MSVAIQAQAAKANKDLNQYGQRISSDSDPVNKNQTDNSSVICVGVVIVG